MTSYLRFTLSLIAAFAVAIFDATAQQTLPFLDGFEDAEASSRWTFIQPTSPHRWCIGNATSSLDSTSLYVSADGGKTLGYTNTAKGVAAYTTYTLAAGYYDISFDYRVVGEVDSKGVGLDSLYVYWITDPTTKILETNGDHPQSLSGYRKTVENSSNLRGPDLWYHSTFRVRVRGNNTEARLVFYWVNNSTNIIPPGVAIDNVQITSDDDACPAPTNFKVSHESGAKLSWDATSAHHYQILYKNTVTGEQVLLDSIYDNPYTAGGLNKSNYSFWLRAICGTDTSGWATYTNHVVAVSTDKCINFIDIHNPDVVECHYGRWGENSDANAGVVDNGYASNKSQHTVHYQQGEFDHMIHELPTIPKGEFASVRLGNWYGGSEAESMKYKLTVDAANPILIIKYASIMRNYGHNGEDRKQPRFIVRVTDQRDKPLDQKCLSVEYLTGSPTLPPGWNISPVPPGESCQKCHYEWKPWTTMGMNLTPYIGRIVYLYLETGDCSPVLGEGCPGYAYFTLDCVSDKLSGLTCGAAAEKIDTVWAPKGFRYEWALKRDPHKVLYTDQFLVPQAGDTATYVCRMNFMDPGREECAFELEASLSPRYAAANASYTTCRKTVSFVDSSTVFTINGVTAELPDVFWDFGDGVGYSDEHNPVYTYENDGRYEVVLRASIDNGMCDSIWSTFIEVSGDTLRTIDTMYVCPGERVLFGNKYLREPGIYYDSLYNRVGCDSISILDLRYHNTTADSVICGGEVFIFEGKEYKLEHGIHEFVYQNIKSAAGCDSTLRLEVSDEIEIILPDPMCADDENIVFSIAGGVADSVRMSLDADWFTPIVLPIVENTFTLSAFENGRAGIYKSNFAFYNEYCGVTEIQLNMTIRYPSSIITQRWNDVLAVQNVDYNGGYDFSSSTFQWLADDALIEGQTHSICYISDGNLDYGKEYTVLVTSGGVSILSCPFVPQSMSIGDNDLSVTFRKENSSANVTINAPQQSVVIRVFDTIGRLYSQTELNGGVSTIQLPSAAGLYIMHITFPDGHFQTHKLIVEDK